MNPRRVWSLQEQDEKLLEIERLQAEWDLSESRARDAVQEEREAVVAWLRLVARAALQTDAHPLDAAINHLADTIANGQHEVCRNNEEVRRLIAGEGEQ